MNSYKQIKKWREEVLPSVSTDHIKLNTLHDDIMKQIITISIEKVSSEWGPPPTHFAFFLMGSAGRFEQALFSDQDHGIIFEGGKNEEAYFLALGSEIVEGFAICGYERCDGNVMASNTLWCKSRNDWQLQIANWLQEKSWQSLRNFSIFFDSRVLYGEVDFLNRLKELSFQHIEEDKMLYERLVDNVGYVKKGIGVLGQILTDSYGEHAGKIHVKEKAFFPYINALRLLALKEKIFLPSTLSRFRSLPSNYVHLREYQHYFNRLLHIRLLLLESASAYDEVHHITVKNLSKSEKRELKQCMVKGYELFRETKALVSQRS
ncbi:DUF294 nucleotidyltransferase-like domain-containing protein [Evansella sp. AB-rgal1]|uniref:DUF294 nucleotidyltransferase-like domain-containing protein n=1 Tax=Evansella sp. AB-rgal1 TaxID=3242696 RepID=UPI00359E3654